eukprot:CAMPEP_0196132990 /NCGR_PEP_ID=MMETSP0910-20130528/2396_1 /TAXON_ID=49265 /ORGANISM="Thalassiosira rotula, Strain GSO102" /LENGTH=185 /DNA_ID=CAMNT_0041392661 /DNA_START=95 /DNA_END=652 /DNA_ORIENTATION=+
MAKEFFHAFAIILLSACFLACNSDGRGVAHAFGNVYPKRRTISFISQCHHAINTNNSCHLASTSRRSLDKGRRHQQQLRRDDQKSTIMRYSSDDDNDIGGPTNAADDITTEGIVNSSRYDDDPDGVPLFDTNERGATLFGLEPNADVDPLDNGLQFTGPVILFFSVYVTLSLFLPDDMPPLDLSM